MIDTVRNLRKEGLLFVNKKKQKNFYDPWVVAMTVPTPPGAKVFCFFFSKKKLLLSP